MPELLEQSPLRDRSAEYPALPVPGRVSEETRRAARSDLRRQIAALELELAQLFASAFPRRGLEFGVSSAGGPRVLGLAELERLRDSLAARVEDVRGWLSDRGYAELRKRELLESLIAEPERFPWVRISNEDVGEPGCRHWHSRPRWGPLGMLMGWWRVKLSSGCPLAKGRGPAASRSNTDRRGEQAQEAPPACRRARFHGPAGRRAHLRSSRASPDTQAPPPPAG